MKKYVAAGVVVVLLIVALDIGRLSGIFSGFGGGDLEGEVPVGERLVDEGEVVEKDGEDARLEKLLEELGITGDEGQGVWRNEIPEDIAPIVDVADEGREWVDENRSVYFIRSGRIFDGKAAQGKDRELLGLAVRKVMLDLPESAVVFDVDWASTGRFSPLLFVRGELELTERVRMAYELILLE